jgi:mRNA (2'-O-methyladenosine-N6-)-methyltransferase
MSTPDPKKKIKGEQNEDYKEYNTLETPELVNGLPIQKKKLHKMLEKINQR